MKPASPRAHLDAMEAERDHLLASITDLDHEHASGELDEDDYIALRRAYVARAAAALRAIEDARVERAADVAPAPDTSSETAGTPAGDTPTALVGGGAGPSGRRRTRRRWAVAVAAGAFAAGAVVVVFTVATGGVRAPTAAGTASAPDVGLVVQELSEARSLSARGDDAGALDLYDKVLAAVPHQAEALAYRGWILRQAGVASGDRDLLRSGRASVEAAVSADPTYPDARAFLGYIRLQDQHDAAGAVAQFRRFLADHPPAQMVSLTYGVVAQAFAAVHQPVPPASPPPG